MSSDTKFVKECARHIEKLTNELERKELLSKCNKILKEMGIEIIHLNKNKTSKNENSQKKTSKENPKKKLSEENPKKKLSEENPKKENSKKKLSEEPSKKASIKATIAVMKYILLKYNFDIKGLKTKKEFEDLVREKNKVRECEEENKTRKN